MRKLSPLCPTLRIRPGVRQKNWKTQRAGKRFARTHGCTVHCAITLWSVVPTEMRRRMPVLLAAMLAGAALPTNIQRGKVKVRRAAPAVRRSSDGLGCLIRFVLFSPPTQP